MLNNLPKDLISTAQDVLEARRNPEMNPRIGPYTQLEKYKDDSDIYISFTDVDKIGIKPLSDFETPLGIYTYPLKLSWKFYRVERVMKKKIKAKEKELGRSLSASELAREEETTIQEAFPFASGRPYIQVLTPSKPVTDLQKFSKRDFIKATEKISKVIDDSEVLEMFKELVDRDLISIENYNEPEGESIWSLTRELIRGEGEDDLEELYDYFLKRYGTNKSMRAWNYFLRDIGFNAFLDKGDGIIHPKEPLQAVFLHRGAFKKINMIYNKTSVLSKEKLPDWVLKAKTFNVDAERGYESGDFVNVTWNSGIWEDGIWKGGLWKGGIFKGGTWESGVWETGIFQGGTWEYGTWEGGSWEGGTWIKGYLWSKRLNDWAISQVDPNEFKRIEMDSKGPDEFFRRIDP